MYLEVWVREWWKSWALIDVEPVKINELRFKSVIVGILPGLSDSSCIRTAGSLTTLPLKQNHPPLELLFNPSRLLLL